MNKIFKIVWNAARGKMMVVNEATSSIQTGKKAAVTVAVIGALASGSALAEFTYTDVPTDLSTTKSVIFQNNKVTYGTNSEKAFDTNGSFGVAGGVFEFADGVQLNFDGNFKLARNGGVNAKKVYLTNFDSTNSLEAENIYIYKIDQKEFGGLIKARKEFTIEAASFANGMSLGADTLNLVTMTLTDSIVDASVLNLKKTLTVKGVSDISKVDKFAFSESSRIENWTDHTLKINAIEVDGTGEAKLVNKTTMTSGYAFDIDEVTIAESGALAIYADDQRSGDNILHETEALGAKLGDVSLGKGASLQLGWRSSDYQASGESVIDTLKLGEDASVSAMAEDGEGSNPATDSEPAGVQIKNIVFEGNNADIDAAITGEATDISVGDGVEGASVAKLSAKKARIQISNPATEGQLGIEEVAECSSVDVTTGTENNTGDAQADLDKLAKAISVETNNGTVNLSIGESDYDGAVSGQLGSDGTATNVVQQVNSLMSNTLDIATAAPLSMNRLLMNDVRKRMGDLRAAEGTHGVWARYDGGKFKGDAGLENDFNTIQVGIDTVPVADAPRFGVAFAYTKSDADMNRGSADMDAFSLAFYGTKFYDNGMFIDVIGRMATADTDLTVDGDKKGSMDNVALSLSGELGWRFDVTEKFYFEPQAELTYTYVNADKLTLSNGSSYDFDAVDSLLGRVGFAAGFKCPSNFGDVYVRASAVHEFLGDSAVTGGNGTIHEVDGEDTWVEFGIGANFNINKNTYVYADIERTEGAKLEEDWRANVGVRYAF